MLISHFLEDVRSKAKEYGIVEIPASVKSDLISQGGVVRYGSYLYSIPDPGTSRFPYLSMRLYSDSLEVRFTLGESLSPMNPKRIPFLFKVGELVVYNPLSKGPAVDQKGALFYLSESIKNNGSGETGRYFDIREDGVYVKTARSRSPLGSLVPDVLPAYMVYTIGTLDITIDIAAKVGEALIPLASVSYRDGIRSYHVLEPWE